MSTWYLSNSRLQANQVKKKLRCIISHICRSSLGVNIALLQEEKKILASKQSQRHQAVMTPQHRGYSFCYTSASNCADPPGVALVMTDNWSKAFLSVPVKKRGGQASIAHMVDGIVHFSTQLGYSSICLKADNEGSCKAVKEQVQKKRGALGLSTTLADSVPHARETNGAAERAIQTVRRLANTFLDTQSEARPRMIFLIHTYL